MEEETLGRKTFRGEINEIIRHYFSGWEITNEGYIRELPEAGLLPVINETSKYEDEKNVDSRIERAKEFYLKYGATLEDKKAALRKIGDALEFIRSEIAQILPKEEIDLFN